VEKRFCGAIHRIAANMDGLMNSIVVFSSNPQTSIESGRDLLRNQNVALIKKCY
jgi:hypothetical protein